MNIRYPIYEGVYRILTTILDIAKVKESATFLVSKDPVKTELGSFYRIILSCPILPKNKPKL